MIFHLLCGFSFLSIALSLVLTKSVLLSVTIDSLFRLLLAASNRQPTIGKCDKSKCSISPGRKSRGRACPRLSDSWALFISPSTHNECVGWCPLHYFKWVAAAPSIVLSNDNTERQEDTWRMGDIPSCPRKSEDGVSWSPADSFLFHWPRVRHKTLIKLFEHKYIRSGNSSLGGTWWLLPQEFRFRVSLMVVWKTSPSELSLLNMLAKTHIPEPLPWPPERESPGAF